MSSRLARALCCAALGVVSSCAHTQTESTRIFQFFSDSAQQVPRPNEPYSISQDGKPLEFGVTDKDGAVNSRQRVPRTSQEFVLRLFSAGAFAIHVDPQGKSGMRQLSRYEYDEEWMSPCRDDRAAPCRGPGFYWIRVRGFGTIFAGEPYVLTIGSERRAGKVSDDGYIVVSYPEPAAGWQASLRFCAADAVDLRIATDAKRSLMTRVAQADAAGRPDAETCRKSSMPGYATANRDWNGGSPYLEVQWSQGATPAERQAQAQAQKQAAQERYRAVAAANDDPLSWLGPLPVDGSVTQSNARMSALVDKIRADLSADPRGADPRKFVCRKPAQVGPVPKMEAVEAFLQGLPGKVRDPRLQRGLFDAARAGNWLAVVQVFSLSAQRLLDGDPQVLAYRSIQLMEWLQARKLGALYREYGEQLAGSGYYDGHSPKPDPINIYAALHDSYPAQFDVGRDLASSNDPGLRKIGASMQACARSALPAYAKLFAR